MLSLSLPSVDIQFTCQCETFRLTDATRRTSQHRSLTQNNCSPKLCLHREGPAVMVSSGPLGVDIGLAWRLLSRKYNFIFSSQLTSISISCRLRLSVSKYDMLVTSIGISMTSAQVEISMSVNSRGMLYLKIYRCAFYRFPY